MARSVGGGVCEECGLRALGRVKGVRLGWWSCLAGERVLKGRRGGRGIRQFKWRVG